MPSPSNHKKAFLKAFRQIALHQDRHNVFQDFLELAYCAVRKTTTTGETADKLEARYMAVVARHKPDDIRAVPELVGLTALGLQEGSCDFLGEVAGELELLNSNMGQFFTPYSLSQMMAEMSLQDVTDIIDRKGFVTVQEPACGAGGMILAAADVISSKGYDIGEVLYVDAVDLSEQCFKMSYLQASLRGVPAMIRRGNSLSLEMFEEARTPSLLPFLLRHGDPFKEGAAEVVKASRVTQPVTARQSQTETGDTVGATNATPPDHLPVRKGKAKGQMDLFDL